MGDSLRVRGDNAIALVGEISYLILPVECGGWEAMDEENVGIVDRLGVLVLGCVVEA